MEKNNGNIRIYISSVSGNRQIKKRQNLLRSFLLARKICFEEIDLAQEEEIKQQLKKDIGPTIKPPIIFVDNKLCGTFSDFEDACEEETLDTFFNCK